MIDYTWTVLRQRRKTVVLRAVAPDRIEVRVPMYMPEAGIRALLRDKSAIIQRLLSQAQARAGQAAEQGRLTEQDIRRLARQATAVLPGRLRHFAPLVGVSYGKVSVRCQKTRWGSCSAQGNLSFNCLLAAAPPEVLDYVVVHELCHRLEMNHSPRFWAEVARVLPGYEQPLRWFKPEGTVLMERCWGK